jgi:hypothetical protein
MISKVREKEKAMELRRKGYSYKEIQEVIPVAKSSLSLWLKDFPLTDSEKHTLKGRKDGNISRGRIRAAASNRMRRVVRDGFLFRDAKREFEEKSKDPFFHVGVALYWGEGAKRNTYFCFTNSDSEMMAVMVTWIEKFLSVKKTEIRARLYTHKPFAHENSEKYWSDSLGLPIANFRKTVYKPTRLLVKKRPNYKGCLRIELPGVTNLRKMLFWQKMLFERYKK